MFHHFSHWHGDDHHLHAASGRHRGKPAPCPNVQDERGDLAESPKESNRSPIRFTEQNGTIRIFTCIGRSCREAKGGPSLADALHRELVEAGPAAAHIDVKSCGCLDRCKEGPVAVAFRGKAALQARPPHGFFAQLINRPLGVFRRVTPADSSWIISSLLKK